MAQAQASPDRQVERRRLIIFGVVQGVGYRYFAQRAALKLGIKGWVRNLSDGSVEVVAEGPHHTVEELIFELREGPSGAVVAGMEVTDYPGTEPLTGFEIRP